VWRWSGRHPRGPDDAGGGGVASKWMWRRSGKLATKEEEWRRRLHSVVAMVEASSYTGEAATSGRTTWFPGVATTWRQLGRRRCGPDGNRGCRGGAGVDLVVSRSARDNLVAYRCEVQILR
jgi:hypothetical protein